MAQLFDYHYWANRRMISVAAGLSIQQLHQEQGHSWGSIFGVLLHMLNAEWIWLRRWQGESPRAFMDLESFPSLAHLSARWAEQEREMRSFITAQTPQSLLSEVVYTSTRGETYHLPLWQMMVHVPNHATHHRGELAAMFALLDVPHPEEDWLHYFLYQSEQRQE